MNRFTFSIFRNSRIQVASNVAQAKEKCYHNQHPTNQLLKVLAKE